MAQQYQVGQSGIPFGGGQFQETADGWFDPVSGRRWDSSGNAIMAQAQPVQQAQVQATTTSYTAPVAAAPTALQQQQAQGQQILNNLPSPIKVNVAQFNRLNTSGKDFVLGAYEAKGYDKNDVLEQFDRMLPKATGPKRSYVAPLGGGMN
jgi:hypothetical protein